MGFALTILQRRLASSPEAIYQSLRRRRERLEHRLNEERLGKTVDERVKNITFGDDFDEDDYSYEEMEEVEELVSDQASAASTIRELEAEITILRSLEQMANAVRISGEDRKWDELSKLLQDDSNMFSGDGQREKLIIFTEHKDTLQYLTDKIRTLFGHDEAVVTIHGGMRREERRRVEEQFKQDKDVRILIATDAAGEGINLQRAHLMVNYDLPWNPNRLEQRFGRIHRIGQTEVCHLWNLVSNETREGMVFERLFRKLEEERAALNGKVFDILGKVTFNNKSLRDLLIEAVRYGNDPEVKARLWQVVDNSLERSKLRSLIEERALTEDTMDVSRVMEIREEMERMEAHKLQPHFVEAFFIEAFRNLGGKIHPRERGRYEITSVPYAIRNRDTIIGFGGTIPNRYERICFSKEECSVPGELPATLICPGHPLLEATISLLRERNGDIMKRGTVFIDDTDYGKDPRLLFYIEDSVQDDFQQKNGEKHIISKHIHFVEIKENGEAKSAGYAPYLDYRKPTEEERDAILPYLDSQRWLKSGVEEMAYGYAVSTLVPEHMAEVRSHRHKMLDKIAKAVKNRMTQEIQYWDFKAAELKQKEAAGKPNARLNSENAARRAEELESRMKRRLDEIEMEKKISALPPVIVGGALVIPKGLVHLLTGEPDPDDFGGGDRKAVEYAAMNAVMEIERRLGYDPKDVSAENCGYDILSVIPKERRDGTATQRFIEVKGRKKGADTVTVSKNEMLVGMNNTEKYILAIVEVDGEATKTRYLQNPFVGMSRPDFRDTTRSFNVKNLASMAKTVYQE